MTNRKTTKRALVTSCIAMLLCFSMLIGTTFAWFTDSVTSANNVIKTGNLDIAVEYTLDGKTWNDLDGADDLFRKSLWEPGHTEVVALKVTNKGSLALKYMAELNVLSELVGKTESGESIVLSEILTVSSLCFADTGIDPVFGINIGERSIEEAFKSEDGIAYGDPVAFKDCGLLADDKLLAPGDINYIVIKVDMDETVGNEANHDGRNIPSIEFGVNVLATQASYESDSFDETYDSLSDYVAYFTSGYHVLNATLEATDNATDVVTATGADTTVVITGGHYDANSRECAVWAYDGATVIIKGGTFVQNGSEAPATSASHIDLIYAGSSKSGSVGTIKIEGGFFYVRNKGGAWLLNENDANGTIEVTGGTFVNWNPADNESEGANTSFLADGYTVRTELQSNGDVWYTVIPNANNSGNIVIGENATVEIKDETVNGTVTNMGGDLTVKETTLTNKEGHQYGALLRDGSITVFEDVIINNTTGGGINVGNCEAIFKSGTVDIANTKSRHLFYCGTDNGFAKLTVEGGTFNLKNKTNSSAYLVADGEGAVIIVNGGTFNAASTKKAPVLEANGGEVIIQGGTFYWDPSEWVADGYVAKSEVQADGKACYTVVPLPEGYEKAATAQDVAAAIASGNDVALTADIVITETLDVKAPTNIELNGRTLTVSHLESNSTLTVNGGTLVNGESDYPAISVNTDGALVLNDVKVVGGTPCNIYTSGSLEAAEIVGIQVFGGECVLNDCDIYVEVNEIRYANSVFAVGIHGGSLTMNGGSITVKSAGSTSARFDDQGAFFALGDTAKSITLNDVDVNAPEFLYAWGGTTTVNTTASEGAYTVFDVSNGATYTVNYNYK